MKTSELAQAAEYLSGLDIRLTQIRKALLGESEDSRQRCVFSLVLGGGASGSLTNQTASPVALYPSGKFEPEPGSADKLLSEFEKLYGYGICSEESGPALRLAILGRIPRDHATPTSTECRSARRRPWFCSRSASQRP